MRTAPISVVASIDTVELWLPRPLRAGEVEVRAEIERALGGRRFLFERRLCGVMVAVNRPPLERLAALDVVRQKHRGAIHRCDLALDLDFGSWTNANRAGPELDRMIAVRWRAKGADIWHWREGDGFCWVFQPGSRRAGRWLNRYRKTDTAQRLELKFTCAAAVRRSGIRDLGLLARISPRELFAHHVKFLTWKKAYRGKVVKAAIEAHRSSPASRFRYDAGRAASNAMDRAYMQDAERRRTETVEFPVPDRLGPVLTTNPRPKREKCRCP